MKNWLAVMLLVMVMWTVPVLGDQQLVSAWVTQPPIVDGNGHDPGWSNAVAVVTQDWVTQTRITLKSVHTDQEVFFSGSLSGQR